LARASGAALIFAALGAVSLNGQVPAGTPAATSPSMGKDEITAFAKLQVAISQVRDSIQAQLAQARNKTPQAQQQLRDKLHAQVEDILHHAGVTDDEFQRKTYIVSTDSTVRKMFDAVIAQLTGVPTPGQVQAAPTVKVPAGDVGVHIGHVVNGFRDTPNGQGLLPTAFAEAKTAAQHAAIAARNASNLDAMKLHAGHVINAVDPTVVPMGPGLGYGVKKAALGVATHIELAAKAPGASQNVITHATHVATSARNTVERADSIVALAKQIQAATSADEAAKLVGQLVSLTNQLTAGFDANGDGRITWQQGEGGLQQAQDHVNLMLAGEGLKP
jgi:hypothetical protein